MQVIGLIHIALSLSVAMGLSACHAQNNTTQNENNKSSSAENVSSTLKINQSYQVHQIARFNEPWAMALLPDGRLLITEKQGKLQLFNPVTKQKKQVAGVPQVAYGGQGGLGDIVLGPEFAKNHHVYLSYAEAGQGGYGAVVVRAELDLINSQKPQLKNIQRIWTQVPKVMGRGHYAHRLLFGSDGTLWISSGERQQFDPAQDLQSNLGKILRLHADGSVMKDNPFMTQGEIAKQIWTLGHRNPLGMAFDSKGQLWVAEMGPKGGDELNLIVKGANYGYPIVSNGDHYDGTNIPDHHTHPEFKAPELDWTPVISPSSLIFYTGDMLPQWKNKALLGGLSSQSIVVVDTRLKPVQEVQRLEMNTRIRGLLQASDGDLWVIEDGRDASLLKLTAK